MTNTSSTAPGDDIPEAIVQKRRKISFIWIVPLVAALVGGWVAYKVISEQGPLITIHFKTAEGLVAGKTKVKYKDVDVGQIESIELDHENMADVIVKVRMTANSEKYLTEKTRFWVVRAAIRAGAVTGLGTILSGAYIGVDPVKDGVFVNEFTGLEQPPQVTKDQVGQQITLKAKTRSSLDIGSPVYFRQVKVGEVVGYALADDGDSVEINIFVNDPHHKWVNEHTLFWEASGFDVSLSAEGLKMETESMVSVLIGGVAFTTPEGVLPGKPVVNGHTFRLFDSYEEAIEPETRIKRKYLLTFDGSVRGLTKGAPVEFRGIPFGQVLDIDIAFDEKAGTMKIPVLVEAEPERLDESFEPAASDKEALANLEKLVAKGLRGQLKTGNLLTGQLYIELDFHPDAEPARLDVSGKYPGFPTIPSTSEELTRSVTAILDKLERFPLDEIGENLNDTITHADSTVQSIDRMFSADAPLRLELQDTMTELSEAARSLRVLTDYLERHPEALIRGKTLQ